MIVRLNVFIWFSLKQENRLDLVLEIGYFCYYLQMSVNSDGMAR